MQLLPHQQKAKAEGLRLLYAFNIFYLAGEVRTGKTLTALSIADAFLLSEHKSLNLVLCVTSKKAIPSIQKDFTASGIESYVFRCINYEQLENYSHLKPTLLILDEAHRLGQFPKPGKTAKLLRKHFHSIPTILMSGTPSPESFSQLYHQFWVTAAGPWKKYGSFYKWAHDYVNVTKSYIGMGMQVNNYSEALPTVALAFGLYSVSMTQADAGFNGTVVEQTHILPMPAKLKKLLKELTDNEITKTPELTADTAGKLSSYYHQIGSGTVIDDDEVGHILSDYKARYIKERFAGKRIAIFYCFKAEGEILKKLFKNWTNVPEDFQQDSSLTFIGQIQSVREGTNLSHAEELIYYNVPYSAVSYWQGRARSQSFTGGDKRVHFLLSDCGVEQDIYNVVIKEKKKYTTKHFIAYAGSSNTIENSKAVNKAGVRSNTPTGNLKKRLSRLNGIAGRMLRVR